MKNEQFNYYIHNTSEADYESFFKNGIYDYDSTFRIESTIARISDEDVKNGHLEKIMKSFREDDENIFLIKIPKHYFPSVIHRDGSMDIPIPFLSEKHMNNTRGREGMYPVIIPNLIQGCYNKKNGFITNENYCPVFDPSGLKFAYEQLEPIKNENYDLYQQYYKRNSKWDLKTLYEFDKSTGTWNAFVEYYSKLFGVEPVIPCDDGTHNKNISKL